MIKATDRPSFGELLREFRLDAGLSQEALAERARLSVDSIGALERGINKTPQRETLTLLLEALQLDPNRRRSIEAAAARPSLPRPHRERTSKRHNLPRPLAPLIGRERDLEEVRTLLVQSRVLTLTGTGGVGKTRLAIEAATADARRWADGVRFVDLTPARDASAVASAIASVFGVRERAGEALLDAIVDALARKNLLLILDNCEQVAAAAAAAAISIAAACADVRILATSRQPLHISGEQTYRVASLNAQSSVELFVDCAQRADTSAGFEDADFAVIDRICKRLDGIALAIELAAARVKLLSLVQIEELLDERFRVLAGEGYLARHQTVRALVDWSYDLLSEHERELFNRLGVFASDFSLEAAVAICSGEGFAESKVIGVLGSLVDKSLLTSERRGKIRRFRLLETMRAYAREMLAERIEALAWKHAEYFVRFVEAPESSQDVSMARLENEHENLRQALGWSIDADGDATLGVRLLAGLRDFLLLRGLAAETARRGERLLKDAATLSPPLVAMAWETLSAMRGDLLVPAQSLDAANHSLALYEELGDGAGMARALRSRGIAYLRLRSFASAQKDLDRALELVKQFGNRRDLMRTLASIGSSYEMTGRLEEARRAKLEVLEMSRAVGDERLVWVSLMNLAETEFALGETDRAISHVEELLARKALHKNPRMRALAKSNLAAYSLALHRVAQARAMARSAVFDARAAGDVGVMSCALGHLAAILGEREPKTAARLLGYVESIFAEGYHREKTEEFTYDLLMAALRRNLSHDELPILQREGSAMSEAEAVRLATR